MQCASNTRVSNNLYLSGAALWSGGALLYLLQRSGVLASSWKPRTVTLFCASGAAAVAGIAARVLRIREERRRIAFAEHFLLREGEDKSRDMLSRPFTSAKDRNFRLLRVANAMLEPNSRWEQLIKDFNLDHSMQEFMNWGPLFFFPSLHEVAIKVTDTKIDVSNGIRNGRCILPAPSSADRPYLEDDLYYIACVICKLYPHSQDALVVSFAKAVPGVSDPKVEISGIPINGNKFLTPAQYYKIWCKRRSQ